MNREVAQIKKRLEEMTPREKKWGKLLIKNDVHPREEVIERWVKFQQLFDEEESEDMNRHYAICERCRKERDNVMPLLQKAS